VSEKNGLADPARQTVPFKEEGCSQDAEKIWPSPGSNRSCLAVFGVYCLTEVGRVLYAAALGHNLPVRGNTVG
jgi:hypothetical protein